MGLKKWNILHRPKLTVQKYIMIRDQIQNPLTKETIHINNLLLTVLKNRGFQSSGQVAKFLFDDHLSNPFDFKDMEIAVRRIYQAIEREEKILIYGDYDADGITATCILYSFLRDADACVTFYIPERQSDGYGLSKRVIDVAKEKCVGLIITVDNGISCIDEALYCKSLGIDLIITDHHQIGERLPKALAIINPHQYRCKSKKTCKNLCGAGVVFKLVSALLYGDNDYVIDNYSHIAAIGTIGDVVPLRGENRVIVKYGIERLKQTENSGLLALTNAAGVKNENLSSQSIAFTIVPRINAAGRMGTAKKALKLLLCEDEEDAQKFADEINELNNERKKVELEIMEQCEKYLKDNPEKRHSRIGFFYGKDWHEGVIGIVAAKMMDKYQKPVVLLSVGEKIAKGSARSYGAVNIFNAFCFCDELLYKYGGHSQAAGCSLETKNIDEFERTLEEYARDNYYYMPAYTLDIEKEVKISEITLESVKNLAYLEPYGKDNPLPVFCVRNAVVSAINPLAGGKYIKFSIQKNGEEMQILSFSHSFENFSYKIGDEVSVAFNVSINVFNNNESVSCKLVDIIPAALNFNIITASNNIYGCLKRNEIIKKDNYEKIIPTDNDMKIVYSYLKKNGGCFKELEYMSTDLLSDKISHCKMLLCLEILQELDLIEWDICENKITLKPFDKKSDFKKTKTYNNIINTKYI